jgi:hypothetical protein
MWKNSSGGEQESEGGLSDVSDGPELQPEEDIVDDIAVDPKMMGGQKGAAAANAGVQHCKDGFVAGCSQCVALCLRGQSAARRKSAAVRVFVIRTDAVREAGATHNAIVLE